MLLLRTLWTSPSPRTSNSYRVCLKRSVIRFSVWRKPSLLRGPSAKCLVKSAARSLWFPARSARRSFAKEERNLRCTSYGLIRSACLTRSSVIRRVKKEVCPLLSFKQTPYPNVTKDLKTMWPVEESYEKHPI